MITVFTPVYNRAYIINRLYESLCNQTDKRFEWLVIDDGSTDNIDQIINECRAKDPSFSIQYYKQKNGGKHRAFNNALDWAKGEYFFVVDSDDYLSSDAIKKIYLWIDDTENEDDLIGISGQRAYPNGELIGRFPNRKDYVDVKQSNRKRKGIIGDKAEIYKTSILRTKKFPEFEGENFIAEGALMYQFSIEGYKIRYYPDVIYFGEYLEDGLTRKNDKTFNNYKGYCFFEKLNIQACAFPDNILSMMRYIENGKEKGTSRSDIMEDIGIGKIQYYYLVLLSKAKRIIRKKSMR